MRKEGRWKEKGRRTEGGEKEGYELEKIRNERKFKWNLDIVENNVKCCSNKNRM